MGVPSLDLLLPADRARRVDPDDTEQVLTALYPPVRGVRAMMVQTLDGAAHGADGRSGSINDAADRRVFEVVRAAADAVLVGAGTVRREGYRALRTAAPLVPARTARGQAAHPVLVVVTRRGDLPVEVLEAEPRPYVATVDDAPFLGHLRAHLPPGRLLVHPDEVDVRRVLDTLAGAGLASVLLEGGPALLGRVLTAGLVDELCLTRTPLVVGGDAGRVVAGPWLDGGRADLRHLLHGGGTLLERWSLPAAIGSDA